MDKNIEIQSSSGFRVHTLRSFSSMPPRAWPLSHTEENTRGWRDVIEMFRGGSPLDSSARLASSNITSISRKKWEEGERQESERERERERKGKIFPFLTDFTTTGRSWAALELSFFGNNLIALTSPTSIIARSIGNLHTAAVFSHFGSDYRFLGISLLSFPLYPFFFFLFHP